MHIIFLSYVAICLVSIVKGLISCPSNGLNVCQNGTNFPAISDLSFILRNCVFIGCPAIQFSSQCASIILQNVTFINSNGYAFSITSPCHLNMSDSTLQNAPILLQGSNLLSRIRGSVFQNSRLEIYGSTNNVLIENSNFTKCSSNFSGAALNMDGGGDSSLTVINSIFDQNRAALDAGAVSLRNMNSTSFWGCSFTRNYASRQAGAMVISSSLDLTISSCLLAENQALDRYGALSIWGGNAVLVSTRFLENTADSCGALGLDQGSYAVIACEFRQNSAISDFGAIYCAQANYLELRSCSFFENSASFGVSGSVQIVSSRAVISSCIFNSDYSYESGGSLYISGSVFSLTNSTFSNSSSTGDGGAIVIDQGSTGSISNCTFLGNSAGNTGGSICISYQAVVSLTNLTGQNSWASYEGGFLEIFTSKVDLRDSRFVGNSAGYNGGAISIRDYSTFSLSGTSIYNSNSDLGGHLNFQSSKIKVSNCLFQGGYAPSGGGWLYVYLNEGIVVSNSRVIDSESGATGGAIAITDNGSGTYLFSNLTVINSVATYSGGFVAVANVPLSFSFVNCTIIGSRALSNAIGQFSKTAPSFLGCVFIDSSSVAGGLFSFQESSAWAVFSDCQFLDSTSFVGILNAVKAKAKFLNCRFTNSTALYGSCFLLSDPSEFYFSNCSFEDMRASLQGTIGFASQLGKATIVDSVVSGLTGVNQAPLFYGKQNGQFEIDGLQVEGKLSNTDGCFALLGSSASLSAYRLNIKTPQRVLTNIFSLDTQASLTIVNSGFLDIIGSSFVSAAGDAMVDISLTTFSFTHNGANQLFSVDDGSQLSLTNCDIVNFQGLVSVLVATGQSYIFCVNSRIAGAVVTESPIQLSESSMDTLGCQLVDNLSLGNFDQCNAGKITAYGGAIFAYSSTVTLNEGTIITGNYADYGGAIYLYQSQLLTIGDGVIIANNSASMQGGAIWSYATEICVGNSNISENAASSVPGSSDFYLSMGTLTSSSSKFPGQTNIYVQEPLLARSLIESNITDVFPKAIFSGSISSLKVMEFSNGSTLYVDSSEPFLPSFTVAPFDSFNRIVPVDLNNLIALQVELVTEQQSSVLSGETTKVLVDLKLSNVLFSDLSISNKVPGLLYQIQVSTPSIADIDPIVFNVTFLECDPNNEVLFNGKTCIPLLTGRSMITTIVVSMPIGVLFPVIAISLYFLIMFQDKPIIKGNSFTFLTTSTVGCLLALFSPLFSLFEQRICCVIQVFLQNMGFTLVFGSLIFKLYRIHLIFSSGRKFAILNSRQMEKLTDPFLFRWLLLLISLMIVYLTVWMALDPPQITDRYLSSINSMARYDCPLSSPFAIVLVSLKALAVIILSYLAFLIRGIPAQFNEAKFIAFACYNWLIFGNFIFLTAEYFFDLPNIRILVQAVTLYLSHSIITILLVTYKIYLCLKNDSLVQSNMMNDLAPNSFSFSLINNLDSRIMQSINPVAKVDDTKITESSTKMR